MIKFGDKNLYVSYIQNFLKENYNYDLIITDEYNINTHRTLINYLKEYEILDCYKLKDELLSYYTYRDVNPPHELIDGGGLWNFNFDISPDYIRFFNRPIKDCLTGGLKFILEHIDSVKSFCEYRGWKVTFYTTYTYTEKGEVPSAEIIIEKTTRKQLLPGKAIIKMINLSLNQFLNNKCFLDEQHSYHGFIQDSDNYSILCVDAKPGEVFTISHAFNDTCEMAIANTNHTFEEIKNMDSVANDIQDHLYNSALGEIKKENYVVYNIPLDSDCKTLLIQINNKRHKVLHDKILVMQGDVTYNNPNNELNIPIKEFNTNPWCIHEEFLSYILGSSIHKYSNFNDIEWLQNNVSKYFPKYIKLSAGVYDESSDYILNEYLAWDKLNSVYKYFKNNVYTGYILDSNDILNGHLIRESDLQKSAMQIKNGKFILHDKQTGSMVLSNGFITKENAINSLREIIKHFQIESNKIYKNNSKEQIKFINGYVNPLTEKRLNMLFNGIISINY